MDEQDTSRSGSGSTRRRFLAGVAAAGTVASTLSVTAADSTGPARRGRAAQEWRMFAADAANTGRNDADAPSGGVAVNWHRDLGSFTEATFDRTTTYVGTEDGTL